MGQSGRTNGTCTNSLPLGNARRTNGMCTHTLPLGIVYYCHTFCALLHCSGIHGLLRYTFCILLYGIWMTVLPYTVTAIRQLPWGVPRGITTTTSRVISHCIAVPVYSVTFKKKIVCRACDMGPHAIYSTSRSNVQWSTLGIRSEMRLIISAGFRLGADGMEKIVRGSASCNKFGASIACPKGWVPQS